MQSRDLPLTELQLLGTSERALADKSYHKSSRTHWGVPMPGCAAFARDIAKGLSDGEVLDLARGFWESGVFDTMMCATKLVTLPRLKPSPAVWKTLTRFLKDVDGWALEDGLAHAAWKCILADAKLLDELETWTKHPNFWMRRAALVYTLPFAKTGQNPERMLTWASHYATDTEWFIQKAIGWWLRVLGEHNPTRVHLFLEAHWHQLKGVARKEATRKLTTELQKKN